MRAVPGGQQASLEGLIQAAWFKRKSDRGNYRCSLRTPVLSEIKQAPTLKKGEDYRGGLCSKTFRRKSTNRVESTTAPSNVLRMRPGPKQVRFTIPFVKPYAA
jgi:hypothetical protein